MESVNELKAPERERLLEDWLKSSLGGDFVLHPLAGDASFRRYFRLTLSNQSYVVMDAPPSLEAIHPFVAIAEALRKMNLQTPAIFAAEWNMGFLLLSDFGDETYLKALRPENADSLYRSALSALAILQTCRQVDGLIIPPFAGSFMQQEWAWHQEWFLNKWLGLTLPTTEINHCINMIIESATTQPQVFMHRDFHSANLMVLPNQQVGILDFQDAFMGPLTYDLVSLLRDCYIDWPEEKVRAWALFYLSTLQAQGAMQNVEEAQFLKWFDWMGIERHLKALFTFARKAVRDQQPHYLQHVPRTLHYLQTVSERYPELAPLTSYIHTVTPAAIAKVNACAQ